MKDNLKFPIVELIWTMIPSSSIARISRFSCRYLLFYSNCSVLNEHSKT
uniref:Uncharacterized protein n=1 Tax=Tetranychus urticae TaxID=32264 RepID=T1K6B7_TETUR